jgi:hypothetical protein
VKPTEFAEASGHAEDSGKIGLLRSAGPCHGDRDLATTASSLGLVVTPTLIRIPQHLVGFSD